MTEKEVIFHPPSLALPPSGRQYSRGDEDTGPGASPQGPEPGFAV